MKQLLIYSIIFILFISCEKDVCSRIESVQIESIQMADTIMLNEIALINIRASATNGCWSDLFVKFEKEDVFAYSVKAFGTYNCFENGCVCPDVMVYLDTIINFQPIQKGTYIFQILKNYNTIITDTLIVR